MKDSNLKIEKKGLSAGLLLVMAATAALCLFGLFGCQSANNSGANANPEQQPLDRRIGIVKSLGGVKTSNSGTHLLQLDDGSTILLKSLQINLDDALYLNKMVEVRGIVTYTTDGKQVMEVMNIDTVETGAISQEIQKSQWKDFKSDSIGISMKYNDILKVTESGDKVTFEREIVPVGASQQTEGVTMESQQNKVIHELTIISEQKADGQTLAEKLKLTGESANDLLAKGMTRSKIGSGNYDSIKETDGNIINYYIDADKHFYTISLDAGQDDQTLPDQNMFYEMLGTFQLSGTQTPSGQSEKDVLNNEGGTAPSTQEIPVPVDSTNDKPALQPAITQADIPEPVTQEAISPETAQEPATQEIPAGFSKIQSATFGFSMEYPKSWYYSGSASSETGVVRHYEFGTKPLEETPGQVSLDLMSGSLPAGIPTEINKIQIVKILSGDNIEYYAKGAGSRIYRITGPSSTANTLLQMAASIEE